MRSNLTRPIVFAASILGLALFLTGCGGEKQDAAEKEGPQSTGGALLDSVQKTVDAANKRTRDVEDAADEVKK